MHASSVRPFMKRDLIINLIVFFLYSLGLGMMDIYADELQ